MTIKRDDGSRGLTREELLSLPAAVGLETANRALSLSRTTGYDLAKRGRYPCTVLRLGNAYRVVTADLLKLLHIDVPEQTGIGEPAVVTPKAETDHLPLARCFCCCACAAAHVGVRDVDQEPASDDGHLVCAISTSCATMAYPPGCAGRFDARLLGGERKGSADACGRCNTAYEQRDRDQRSDLQKQDLIRPRSTHHHDLYRSRNA